MKKDDTDKPEGVEEPNTPEISAFDSNMDSFDPWANQKHRGVPKDTRSTPPPSADQEASLGLEDEAALDLSLPSGAMGSAFEPPTVFDEADVNMSTPRELFITREWNNYVPEVGEVLNERFEIRDVIGVGALGTVYRVDDLRLKDNKALKLMHSELMASPEAEGRFVSEVKGLQRLSHEHIVRVYDLGKTDHGELTYFTMEYVKGATLADILKKKGGRLPLDRSLSIIHQILDTLIYAHKHCVYKNLKPLNVMIRPTGKIVLLNFGISHDTLSKMSNRKRNLGSIHYQAPEQSVDPEITTPQVDIYAVGVLLYQMLTGVVPIGDVPSPSRVNRAIPKRLGRVVMGCLETRPERRYQTAQEVKGALLRAEKSGYKKLLVAALLASLFGAVLWWLYG